jgi:hypothetical protein
MTMSVHAFVFNWRGHEENAAHLAAQLGARYRTTVINSDEEAAGRHPDWVHLDEQAYFSAQWNTARALFAGDAFFHIQADARCDELGRVVERGLEVLERYRAGVYEPKVDYTAVSYGSARLPSLEPDLNVVPLTDCTCWLVAGDIARRLPPVDLAVNRYGWGICAAVAALSHADGRPCLRDLRFTVRHPRSRGYSGAAASRERIAYARSLGPDLGRRVIGVYGAYYRTRRSPAGQGHPP